MQLIVSFAYKLRRVIRSESLQFRHALESDSVA